MTNQQGAPEALRPIQRYKIGYHTDEWGIRSSTPSGIPDHAGAWVRYEDHLAALVEAQQPSITPDGEPSNVELRGLWYGAGGSFHGPNVETGTMPEAKLLPFLRELVRAQHSAPPLLTTDHQGMRVDYSGLLGQCQRALRSHEPAQAEMLRQMQGHIKELGQRWYAGDTAAVDEILQLYCVEHDARQALKGGV